MKKLITPLLLTTLMSSIGFACLGMEQRPTLSVIQAAKARPTDILAWNKVNADITYASQTNNSSTLNTLLQECHILLSPNALGLSLTQLNGNESNFTNYLLNTSLLAENIQKVLKEKRITNYAHLEALCDKHKKAHVANYRHNIQDRNALFKELTELEQKHPDDDEYEEEAENNKVKPYFSLGHWWTGPVIGWAITVGAIGLCLHWLKNKQQK